MSDTLEDNHHNVDDVSKKKEKSKKDKKDKKDKGYMIFEEDHSADELFAENISKKEKSKKTKSFKFTKKEKYDKKEKKDKVDKKKDKEEQTDKVDRKKKKDNTSTKESSKKNEKDKAKWKQKLLQKQDEMVIIMNAEEQKAVFGVPLQIAVERNPSHDGVQLPAVVRECIDYISEYGLACEGIYRVSGVKSKVNHLRDLYNIGSTVYLVDHEPNVVASLLKLFLREIPEPILTSKLMPKFEQASVTKNANQQLELMQNLIRELPVANRTLLSWVIVHMSQVIEKEKFNKMSLQNISIVLSPTMKISHRVLNVLFTYSSVLFKDTVIKKYVPPLKPATSRWTLELPECSSAIEEELKKQESLLNHLHEDLMKVKNIKKEEELWEVQRVVTQLKRKLKHHRQMEVAEENSKNQLIKKTSFITHKTRSHMQVEATESPFFKRHADSNNVDQLSCKLGLSANQSIVSLGSVGADVVKLRYKDHSKKHLTPDLPNRKKHSTELNKRHSSSASADKSLKKIDRKESIASTSSRKLQSTSKQSSLTSIILADAEKLVLESVAELKKKNVKKEHGEEVFLVPESHMNMATVYGQKNEVRCICGDNYDERKLNDVRKRQLEVIGGTNGTEDLNADNDEELAAIEQNMTKELEGHALSETVQSVDQELHDREVTVISIYSDKLATEPKPDKKIDEDDDDDDDSDVKSEAGPSNDYVKLRDESPIGWFAEREAGDASHGGADSSYTDISTGSDDVSQSDADSSWDFDRLLDEYNYLIMEEEELLAIGDELRQKISTERNEIERLQQDISELHMMRTDDDDDAFDSSSTSSSSSSASDISLDDDVSDERLIDVLEKLEAENKKLEEDKQELCEKIYQERLACLEVKVQNRMIQQKLLTVNSSSNIVPHDQQTLLGLNGRIDKKT